MRFLIVAAILLAAAGGCLPASAGAGALLHPNRRPVSAAPPLPHEEVTIAGEGVTLRGWIFRGTPPRRGTIVYLHGVADNRGSVVGIARRFVPRGYDVLAYDSRAHGASTGEACTYGFYEKRDLGRAIEMLGVDRVVLIGSSLGAAVALQAAADDPRVAAVVSVSTFADLRSVARERAPFFASRANIADALAMAEKEGRFRVDDVSPVAAAPRIRAPVLLVHGARDTDTNPIHSQRVHDALTSKKRLILRPGAGHNDGLDEATWREVDVWLAEAAGR